MLHNQNLDAHLGGMTLNAGQKQIDFPKSIQVWHLEAVPRKCDSRSRHRRHTSDDVCLVPSRRYLSGPLREVPARALEGVEY